MSWLARLTAALDAERAWQQREHERALRAPLAEQIALGVTIAPLRVDTIEPAGRGRWRLRLRAERPDILHDGLEAGDRVDVVPIGATTGPSGVHVGRDARVVEVLVDGDEPPDEARPVRLTQRFDPTTFERYAAALRDAERVDTPLRDVLLGLRGPGEPDPDVAAPAGLDPSQTAAARHALGVPDLALIHGPPGTGKTRTLVGMLTAAAAAGERAWALADSNAAVDHLTVRAAAAGLRVVRIGAPARIGGDAQPYTLDARIRDGALGPALKVLDKELGRLRNERGRDAANARRHLYDERDRLNRQARDAVLGDADVIASTLGTLAREAGRLPKPALAIVDEATQALEPAIWTVVPWTRRLVLVGDPHQLGPVVMSPDNLLSRSLLDRLLDPAAPHRPPLPMLTTQYRMHADIEALVQPVYKGALVAHGTVAAATLIGLPGVTATPLTTRPLTWIDTAGAGLDEARDEATQSLYNDGEGAVVRKLVGDLREAGVPADAIAVIAPYRAQVARLRAALPGIEVDTVNAFQGREREAVVCSFVRSNPDGQLGFVADDRRLTVALSRARRGLFCVGDTATLAGRPRFAAVIDAFAARDAIVSVWEPPWTP